MECLDFFREEAPDNADDTEGQAHESAKVVHEAPEERCDCQCQDKANEQEPGEFADNLFGHNGLDRFFVFSVEKIEHEQ